ncbi:MAG TPA: alpha/beta hydrolase family protein [Rhodocyclaceae bacterium]|nr:alpha/beta hydrolase family protein [Rhodocyclaceae bacterium]
MTASLPPEILPPGRSRRASILVVLLPGAYMTSGHFLEAGFAAVLEASRADADLALPAIDLAAITNGSALPRLREEIIEPARRQGYESIWLGGISLGGFMALAYADRYPGEIDGLCLLAPYPGSRITTGAIAAAGGVGSWEATEEQLEDPEFRVWRWLQSRPAELPVFCGYGRDDRFAAGMAMLAATLPGASVRTIPGGHDWQVWRGLWQTFLQGNWLPSGVEES